VIRALLYPDRQGEAVSNSYVIFTPTVFSFPQFLYLLDGYQVNTTTDMAFNLIYSQWQKSARTMGNLFTRAGCNVGAISIAAWT